MRPDVLTVEAGGEEPELAALASAADLSAPLLDKILAALAQGTPPDVSIGPIGYLAPVAAALGGVGRRRMLAIHLPEEAISALEEGIIAHLRGALRGSVKPLNADGTPWCFVEPGHG